MNDTKYFVISLIIGVLLSICIYLLFVLICKMDIIGEQNNKIGEDTKVIRAMLESNNIRYELNQ